ncbi:unnamed protein product [Bursaphelenchus okinawaensis]|uniref:MFS domain-containing protein n=1 Tax=Bursaphelenchus okinawaensis TaxID=465554 RepID=A0A811KWE1_9BILA|nr:unnamed protein product [Bursaphelenchus okinawaensis]CAG9112854.1 unnamed protein product [Bursaphelenchus okinawaensis]
MTLYKSLDEAYEAIERYGRYQVFCFVTTQWLAIAMASFMSVGYYRLGGLVPDYECQDTDNVFYLNANQVKHNQTYACAMVKSCSNLTTHNAWTSIYEEFEWVCEPDYIGSSIASFQSIVHLFGHLLSGHLSDYFGRKWLYISGTLVIFLAAITESLSPTWQLYLAISVTASLVGTIRSSASFPLLVESVHSKYRIIQGYAFQHSLGFVIAGLLAHYTQNWRTHLLSISIFALPSVLLSIFFVESPRYLIQKHKYKKAAEAMNRISVFNGSKVRFTTDDMRTMHAASVSGQSRRRHYTVWHLFSNWRMTSWAISQMLTGITMNIMQAVVFYNIQDLSGNPLTNVSIMGLLRLWTPFVAILLETKYTNFGRKRLMVTSLGTVLICFLSMCAIDYYELNENYRILGTSAVLLGYVVMTGFVWIVYKLYTTELFPTVVRSIALSTFSVASQLGSVTGPQLIYIRKYWHYAPYLGVVLVTTMSLISVIVFLPETKNDPLQDTVHDAKRRKELLQDGEVTHRLIIKDEQQPNQTLL